jgi:hypothetical protein
MVSAKQTMLYHQVRPAQIATSSCLFKTFGSIGSIAASAVIALAFHNGAGDTNQHTLATVMIIVSLALVLADRTIMSRRT